MGCKKKGKGRGKLTILMTLLLLSILYAMSQAFAVVDLRSRIDGATYTPSDSVSVTHSTDYIGYSDTVSVVGASCISADVVCGRFGKAGAAKTTGTLYLRVEGSKDGTKFVNVDTLNDSTTVTTLSTITSFTFPYAFAFNYYRVYAHSDSNFSALIKWRVGGRSANAN